MKIKTLLFLFALIVSKNLSGQSKSYSHDEILEDFEYLYNTLEASHYDLFTNSSKKNYDREYRKIIESIKDSMTSMQVLRLFQPFVALDQHAHCQILPFNLYGEYYTSNGTVFPLNLVVRNNKVLVINNFSSDTTIASGDEVVSVNGKPVKEIINKMHLFFSGESDYLKNTLIEMLCFPRLFWVVYDHFDEFNLELRKREGQSVKITINAITAQEFEAKNAAQKPLMNNDKEFKFIENIAYLHPGVFMNLNAKNEHESSDNREFCRFIDSVFIQIHKQNVQNLIIDLRNNPGGINTFSDYIITYIANKPFRFSDKFLVRTSQKTKEFWKEVNDSSISDLKNDILAKENGDRFKYDLPYNQPRTDSLQYKGKVYVLINRYDFSQAVNVAAVIQDYKFGRLIGEQTADYSSLFGSAHTFTLPNTGLTVQYPKAFIVRPNGNEKAKGVIPEDLVEDDIFSEKDEILEYTLDLIREGD